MRQLRKQSGYEDKMTVSEKSRWLILLVVSSALFLIVIDMTVLYTALPSLARDLGTSASEKLWIINAYALVVAGLLPGLGTLGDRDEATLLFFDATVYPPIGPLPLGTGRAQLLGRLDGISADGGTSLYQAIAQAYDTEVKRAAATPNRIHAVVVMTDGKDESGTMSLEELDSRFPAEKDEAPVKVFTIAYGEQAEGKILDKIAETAKGYSARGSVETIRGVYLDMASFF